MTDINLPFALIAVIVLLPLVIYSLIEGWKDGKK